MPGINDQQRRFAKSPSGVLVPESCFTLDSSNSQTTQPIPGSSGNMRPFFRTSRAFSSGDGCGRPIWQRQEFAGRCRNVAKT